jgi:hypothetical protein
MTFLVWHLLAIGTVMALSFFAGYKFAKRKEDKIEPSIHMMGIKKTRYKYE